MNYNYKTKDCQWRRPVWNQLAERVNVHPRDAIVLYLAGPENLDLEIAQEKGFSRENLIAVEKDMGVVKALRRSGQLTIHGDLLSVLRNWNASRPVHAVIADFCSGLEAKIIGFILLAQALPSFRGSVFAVNFLRGRDGSSSNIRALSEGTKHRGRLYFEQAKEVSVYCVGKSLSNAQKEFFPPSKVAELVTERMRPVFTSYPSTSNQYFDGVIFNNDVGLIVVDEGIIPPESKSVRAQIAAVLAHQTRRSI